MLLRQTLLNCAALEGVGCGCNSGDPVDVCEYCSRFEYCSP